GQVRDDGLLRMGRTPWLPRPGDAHVGAQVARAVGLVPQLLPRSRPGAALEDAGTPCLLRRVRLASEAEAGLILTEGRSSSRGALRRCTPYSPIGRGSRLKIGTVWVRVPLGG